VVGTLFEEPGAFDRDALAKRLAKLAAEGIYIGTSSWKYEGWIGQIYRRSTYLNRGKFSRKLFEQTCLREYAEVFPTVCGDFAFYQFPSDEFWQKLFDNAPPGFRFAFKVPELITCKVFPQHARYGSSGGQENPGFLDAGAFKELFVQPLLPYRDRTSLLIFEFGTFSKKAFETPGEFLARLDAFLRVLPREFRYAVEIRNPDYLEKDYFQVLREHAVAHVYNAWSRMPEVSRQLAIPESATTDFVVCRALLRRGRSYEEAVQLFQPYTEVQDPNPEARDSMRVLITRAQERQQIAFLFVNNRLEGNAPGTIVAITD
jgi:uncharacterized protein YecE (DUF72 family)